MQVLRQYSIAMGLGQKRSKPRRGPKPKLGTEGEDVVKDDAGRVKLVVPARFGLGTVKGAAYKVLQDIGPEGLSITEIARRIQEQGLRDLTTSKTPEVWPLAFSESCCACYHSLPVDTEPVVAVVQVTSKVISAPGSSSIVARPRGCGMTGKLLLSWLLAALMKFYLPGHCCTVA